MYKPILIVTASIAILGGCASMNQSQCLQADWRMIGAEDGSRGLASNTIGNYRGACAKHGITPDLAQYRLGYQEGLASFCTEYMGYTKGRGGYNYVGVCPGDLEPDFLAGYRAGKEIYRVDREVRQMRSTIAHNVAAMDENERLINQKLALIVDSDIPELERVKALVDIKDLQKMQVELEGANVMLADELAVMERELGQLELAQKY